MLCQPAKAQLTFQLYLDSRRTQVLSGKLSSLQPHPECEQHLTQNLKPRASVVLKQTGQHFAGRIGHTEGLSHLLGLLSTVGQKAQLKAFPGTFSAASSCWFAGFRNCSSPHTSTLMGPPGPASSRIAVPHSTCSASGPCRQQQQK